jgi:hypothetical protein
VFEAAGYGKELAAYDAAAPDREAQKLEISEEFIDSLCAIGTAEDVRRGIERYRTSGATNPVVTGVLGTDYAATLRAAAGRES